MIKRILEGVVALFAMGAAVATAVVAAAFALYAVLKESLGPAGAAGVVALVFAIIAGVVAVILAMRARGQEPHGRRREAELSPSERLLQMVRERPVLAAAGALAAGIIALRNPSIIASVVSAVVAARATDKADRRR